MESRQPLLETEAGLSVPAADEAQNQERGLERTLDEIGFGPYQWRLLVLCGLGWMSDNATLQCVAIILPRVQVHFNLTSTGASLLSASTMAGMMVGALTWGALSDILGRAFPFNTTLFLTAVFGLLASFVSHRYWLLCFWMFWLGTAVGGSMPTDGTLFLENLPENKQYLLTLLSVFFSLGAVLSAMVGFLVLPGASCNNNASCDREAGQNDGWRRMLFILGLINFAMFAARFLLFRLHESPRFLVSKRRTNEALSVLRKIAIFNQLPLTLELQDVHGKTSMDSSRTAVTAEAKLAHREMDLGIKPSNQPARSPVHPSLTSQDSSAYLDFSASRDYGTPPPPESSARSVTVRTTSTLQAHSFHTPSEELSQTRAFPFSSNTHRTSYEENDPMAGQASVESVILSFDGDDPAAAPAGLRQLMDNGTARLQLLFVPKWKRITILMWAIWGLMSLAYGMFNVWLPTVLEQRSGGREMNDGLHRALQEYLLYSVAGCPGSHIGAWSIESSLGRRRSLAIFTLATALAMSAFTAVQAEWAVLVSSMLISLAGTAMYAVLYGMTPEVFGIAIRGTACGTSAALSRFTGILAPIVAGVLLSISPALPLIASAAIFAATAGCAILLPFERAPNSAQGADSIGTYATH